MTIVPHATSHQHSCHVNAACLLVCHQLIHGEQSYPAGIAWHTSNPSTNKAGRSRFQAAKLSLPHRLTACRRITAWIGVDKSRKYHVSPRNRVSFSPKYRVFGERYDDVRSDCLARGQQVLPSLHIANAITAGRTAPECQAILRESLVQWHHRPYR